MSAKLLVKDHCQLTFLIKDGSYIPIPTAFANEKISNLLNSYGDNFVYIYPESDSKLSQTELSWQFSRYLANQSKFPNQDVLNFSKIENILLNELWNAVSKDPSITNFQLQNTQDWDFENTTTTILAIARNFESNLQVLSQKESDNNLTFCMEWKLPILEKLLLKKSSPKVIFRLSDIREILISGESNIDLNCVNRRISFSFDSNFKLTRR
jgi:hypothetical protein